MAFICNLFVSYKINSINNTIKIYDITLNNGGLFPFTIEFLNSNSENNSTNIPAINNTNNIGPNFNDIYSGFKYAIHFVCTSVV